MQKITPFLWFNDKAEEAAQFYVSTFKDSKILETSRYGDSGPLPKGTALVVRFQLEGQVFSALNGGVDFPFTEAISLSVSCDSQSELDALSDKLLSEGGKQGRCAWLKDRYGLSWQLVPRVMGKLMSGGDPERSQRVMRAMMQMGKIDIAALQRAYDGVG